MSVNSNSCGPDECKLRDNTTWSILYHFLETRVRYWVSTSRVSFWNGQEEDIIADIVQEAITSTFQYTAEYFVGASDGGTIPWNVLKHVTLAIAYKHYQDLRQRDAQLLCARQESLSSQGYVVYYQQIDQLQIALDDALQKWCSARLGNEIANIPDMPRTALLINLANRMRFDTRPIPLQRALLEEGIQLQDYRQPLPNDPIERGRHKALLRQAYTQIERQQTNLKEQQDTEPIHCSLEPPLTCSNSDPDSVESDPELENLAVRLEATAPFAAVDPAFRKCLRDKLLGILAEQPHHESAEAVLTSVPKTVQRRSDPPETSIHQEPILTSNNSGSDPELATLVAYLDQTSSFAMTDPAFRKIIQDELARIHARYSSSDEGVERALEKTEASLLVAASY